MNNNKACPYKDITILSIFLLIVYMLFLGSHPLISPDETRYAGVAWDMFKDQNYVTPTIAGSPFLGKPILYYWLEIIAYHIWGVSAFAARFFPAVIGVLTCVVAYVFGRTLFDRRTGILCALMLACSPLFFTLAHYSNMDGEVASWIACSLMSFLIAVHKLKRNEKNALWFYAAYAFAALAFLTKGLIGLVFPAMIIFVWIVIRNDWKLLLQMRLLTGLLLFLIIISPWLYLAEKENPGFLYYFFIWNQFFRFVGDDFNQQKPWWFFLPFVIGGIFPFALYQVQSYGKHLKNIFKDKAKYHVELFLILWVVLVTLFFSIPASKLPGYIGTALPPTALLMAIYMGRLWDQLPSAANRWSTWAVIIIYPITAIVLVSLAFIIPEQPGILASAPYARVLAVFMLITAGVLCWQLKAGKTLGTLVTTLIISTFIVCVSLYSSLKTWNLQFNYPIVENSKPYVSEYPDAKLLMFGRYYYSIPMYFDRVVPTVSNWDSIDRGTLPDSWQREIYEGLKYYHHELPQALMTYQTFQVEWEQANLTGKTLNVMVEDSAMKTLDQLVGHHNYKILSYAPTRHVTIVTNNFNIEKK